MRNLEREIGRALRHAAVRIAEGGGRARPHRRATTCDAILGPPRFENEVAMRTSVPGVATGLAWTPVGGDILFIEATRTPGNGKLILTGQLGEVMRESAQAALAWSRTAPPRSASTRRASTKSDIHVHVPAGATPKDGPSAGVAMFMALTSLLTGPHRAQRHGHDRRDQPARPGAAGRRHQGKGRRRRARPASPASCCRRATAATIDDIPEEARDKLEFVWLERVEEAVANALEPKKPSNSSASRPQLAGAEA